MIIDIQGLSEEQAAKKIFPAKICAVCGAEYFVLRRAGYKKFANSKYCTRICAEKAQLSQRGTKACLCCGKEFGSDRTPRDFRRSLYCSKRCSQAKNKPPHIIKHGHARRITGKRTPEYNVWLAMKDRCLNPKCHAYPYYGGRGIAVCKAWADSYAAFISDVGLRPSPELTIERINNDGNYDPGNVRWATWAEQSKNKRKRVA